MNLKRSILSVPGHIAKMHLKASESDADAIMLDLEDSVPTNQKEQARNQVIASISQINWKNKPLSVRINPTDTKFAYKDIYDIVESSHNLIDTIVVPKVNDPSEIHFISLMLDGIRLAKDSEHQIGIEASIETAKGLTFAEQIAQSSKRLRSLIFGIADYSASVGAKLASLSGHGDNEDSLYPGHRWHFAISRIVMVAKAFNLMAIDAPYGNFNDSKGLEKSANIAASLGCDGKWAIHPSQIQIINSVFSPSEEELTRAKKIIEASPNIHGAQAIDGQMIDQATLRLAKKVIS